MSDHHRVAALADAVIGDPEHHGVDRVRDVGRRRHPDLGHLVLVDRPGEPAVGLEDLLCDVVVGAGPAPTPEQERGDEHAGEQAGAGDGETGSHGAPLPSVGATPGAMVLSDVRASVSSAPFEPVIGPSTGAVVGEGRSPDPDRGGCRCRPGPRTGRSRRRAPARRRGRRCRPLGPRRPGRTGGGRAGPGRTRWSARCRFGRSVSGLASRSGARRARTGSWAPEPRSHG